MPRFDPPNVHLGLPGFAPGVRDAIYEHVYSDLRNEVGGMLIGDRRTDGTMIVGAIPAHGADGDVTSLTFTHDSWAYVLKQADARFPGAQIVGWYHSHPGLGIFLSRHDRFIHQHFFSAPWQVAVVVDPRRHDEGLFAWRDGELVQVAGSRVDAGWSNLTPPEQRQQPAPQPAAAAAPAPEADRDRPRTAEELAARRAAQARRARRESQLTAGVWIAGIGMMVAALLIRLF